MPTTIPDVLIPKQTWVNLNVSTGIAVGTQIKITNKGSNAVYIQDNATSPTLKSGDILDVTVNNVYTVPASTNSIWAYSENGTTLSVQESVLGKFRGGASLVTFAHNLGMWSG